MFTTLFNGFRRFITFAFFAAEGAGSFSLLDSTSYDSRLRSSAFTPGSVLSYEGTTVNV